METLELKILWHKRTGNGYYGLTKHRSTLEFLNLGDEVWNEGSQTRVTIFVTFYGIDLYASTIFKELLIRIAMGVGYRNGSLLSTAI